MTPPKQALTPPMACTSSAPGPRKLWRLSAPALTASIRAIFNDTAAAAPIATVFNDPSNLGFAIDANALLVQELNASQLQDNAEAIAAWAASSNKLTMFGNCSTLDAACGTKFVQAFGRRAFRTTLAASDARVAKYTQLFMTGTSYADGAQVVISAMLQSPYFLYRSELGTQSGSAFNLTAFEVATELAYLLTGSTPDDTLLSAADQVAAGSLTMTAMIDAAGDAAAADVAAPSNATAVMGFMTGWLGLDRLYTTAHDDTVLMMSKSVRDAMNMESQSLIIEAFNNGGSFSSALTADHTFLNTELATFYGLPTTGLSTSVQERVARRLDRARSRPARDGDHHERLRASRHVIADAARTHGAVAHALPGRQPAAAERGHARSIPRVDTADHPRAVRATPTTRALATPAISSWTGSGSGSRPTTASGATAPPRTDCRSTAAGRVFSDPAGQERRA